MRRSLEENDYDEDSTLSYVLQMMSLQEDALMVQEDSLIQEDSLVQVDTMIEKDIPTECNDGLCESTDGTLIY